MGSSFFMVFTIGAHWSPLEIIDDDENNLINVLLTIGAHWSPFELEIEDEDDNNLIKKLFSIGTHRSPLELEIVYEGKINLIKKLLTIGAHWSWRIQMGSTFSGQIGVYHCSLLESIGVGEFRWDQHILDTVEFIIGVHWSPLWSSY